MWGGVPEIKLEIGEEIDLKMKKYGDFDKGRFRWWGLRPNSDRNGRRVESGHVI